MPKERNMFKIVVKRDKKSEKFSRLLREQMIEVPIDLEDGGFTIEIFHPGTYPYDENPVVVQGYIGDDTISTTVCFRGSAQLKRATPRVKP